MQRQSEETSLVKQGNIDTIWWNECMEAQMKLSFPKPKLYLKFIIHIRQPKQAGGGGGENHPPPPKKKQQTKETFVKFLNIVGSAGPSR